MAYFTIHHVAEQLADSLPTEHPVEGRYPLHSAALSNYRTRMLRVLSENLVDVNILDGSRCTALGLAAEHGYIDMVRLLLAVEGIDVNKAGFSIFGHPQPSPIGAAVREGHYDVVAVLLEDERVDVNRMQSNQHGQATSILTDAVIAGMQTYPDRGTDAFDIFKLLLSCERIDISQRYFNEHGTPWSSPFVQAVENGWLDVVDLFLKEPRFDLSKQYQGCSYLHPLCRASLTSPVV